MELLKTVAEFLTVLACNGFAGAAVYVSLIEHPARMACGGEVAVTEFAPSYRRGAVMQASLAIAGFLCSVVAFLTGASIWWLVGGLLFVSVVPFTLLVIMPTNKALLDPSLDKQSESARELLSRWGKLHAVRSLVSLLSLERFPVACATALRRGQYPFSPLPFYCGSSKWESL
jgi:anthrone oxygenase-like protein